MAQLSRGLVAFGHEVHIASPPQGPLVDEVLAAGAVHHPAPMFPDRPSAAQVARLRAVMRSVTPDVVHLHGTRAALLGRAALLPDRAALPGAPAIVYTVHGAHYLHHHPPLDRLFAAVERALEGLATDEIIFVSRSDLAGCTAAGATRGRHCTVVHNGVEIPAPPPAVDEPGVRSLVRCELGFAADAVLWLAVGRLSAPKDYPTLLRAVASAAPDMEALPAVVAIAGEGPEGRALHQLVASLKLSGRVSFMGSRPDVPRLMAAADGLVMSSVWEGLPYVALEAMAHHLPIVATRVSGLVEVVEDGETGLLVRAGDPAALARAMLDLSRDPARRRSMGSAGARRVARRFSVEEMVGQTEAVYRRALGRKRALGRRWTS